jgi:hypothetical protein
MKRLAEPCVQPAFFYCAVMLAAARLNGIFAMCSFVFVILFWRMAIVGMRLLMILLRRMLDLRLWRLWPWLLHLRLRLRSRLLHLRLWRLWPKLLYLRLRLWPWLLHLWPWLLYLRLCLRPPFRPVRFLMYLLRRVLGLFRLPVGQVLRLRLGLELRPRRRLRSCRFRRARAIGVGSRHIAVERILVQVHGAFCFQIPRLDRMPALRVLL